MMVTPLTEKTYSKESEEKDLAPLFIRYQSGEKKAFRLLQEALGSRIFYFLKRGLSKPEDAEDLYQECFIRIHRARHTYDPKRSLTTWVFSICRNVMIDFYRKQGSYDKRLFTIKEEGFTQTQEDASPEALILQHESGKLLLEVLQKLPPTQRDSLYLKYFEDLDSKEAAQKLNSTPGSIRVQISKALKELQNMGIDFKND